LHPDGGLALPAYESQSAKSDFPQNVTMSGIVELAREIPLRYSGCSDDDTSCIWLFRRCAWLVPLGKWGEIGGPVLIADTKQKDELWRKLGDGAVRKAAYRGGWKPA
jgi:hypothetical protein